MRGGLGAAGDVDAGGDNVGALAAARQIALERHLEEVERDFDAVLAERQLLAQDLDLVAGVAEGDLAGFAADAWGKY